MATSVSMKAYGGAEVLEFRDSPTRTLLPGEVRIAVTASAVNRADLEIRSGKWPIQAPQPFPYIPGLETCGVVAEVGAGVGLTVGTPVITMMQKMAGIHGVREGGYQSHVVVPVATLAVVPDGINLVAMAAVGLAGVTAFHGIKRLELQGGQRVVIQGVTGGVGSVAALLAGQSRCHVIGVTNRPGKEAQIRALGVAEVWDVSTKPLAEWCTEKVDAVFEMVGGQMFADSVACLKRGGRLCAIGALTGGEAHLSVWDLLNELVLTGWTSENLDRDGLQEAVDTLASYLTSGVLAPPPFHEYRLADAASAHRDMEEGRIFGRVLLRP